MASAHVEKYFVKVSSELARDVYMYNYQIICFKLTLGDVMCWQILKSCQFYFILYQFTAAALSAEAKFTTALSGRACIT